MHYIKAVGWVILGIGIWIGSYFVATILTLAASVYTIGVLIKMERNDVKDE